MKSLVVPVFVALVFALLCASVREHGGQELQAGHTSALSPEEAKRQEGLINNIRIRVQARYSESFKAYRLEKEKSAAGVAKKADFRQAVSARPVQFCLEDAARLSSRQQDDQRKGQWEGGKPCQAPDLTVESFVNMVTNTLSALKETEYTEADVRLLFDAFKTGETVGCEGLKVMMLPEEFQVLPARRAQLVTTQFDLLTGDAGGQLLGDNAVLTQINSDPARFVDTIARVGGAADGEPVTLDVFKKYYKSISDLIMSDDYFELMFRNAWHMAGGEGWSENTVNLRVNVLYSEGGKMNDRIMTLGFDQVARNQNAIKAQLVTEGQIPASWDVMEIQW